MSGNIIEYLASKGVYLHQIVQLYVTQIKMIIVDDVSAKFISSVLNYVKLNCLLHMFLIFYLD